VGSIEDLLARSDAMEPPSDDDAVPPAPPPAPPPEPIRLPAASPPHDVSDLVTYLRQPEIRAQVAHQFPEFLAQIDSPDLADMLREMPPEMNEQLRRGLLE
jgi:hypothetical protein